MTRADHFIDENPDELAAGLFALLTARIEDLAGEALSGQDRQAGASDRITLAENIIAGSGEIIILARAAALVSQAAWPTDPV